uniref:Uncharacterized protein n=1 Tax=Aegilops tauschii subsp. strangulata TaxID=200361 RepID=A0A453L9J2_AEGTS
MLDFSVLPSSDASNSCNAEGNETILVKFQFLSRLSVVSETYPRTLFARSCICRQLNGNLTFVQFGSLHLPTYFVLDF